MTNHAEISLCNSEVKSIHTLMVIAYKSHTIRITCT